MNCQIVCVIGASFGDEGKAKIVDFLSKDFDYVVRYQGGDNAGHSVLIDNKQYVFQLIPSGILNSNAVIAHGVALNPEYLLNEINFLKEIVPIEDRLFISKYVHVIFDWNIALDKLIEHLRAEDSIGTTGKGVGPTYALKALRLNLRICDLLDKDILRKKLVVNLELCNSLFKLYNFPVFDLERSVDKYHKLGLLLKNYLIDSISFLQREYKNGKKILFEGSQGMLLDLDLGTYPFVTSSNIVGALSTGTGLPFNVFNNSIISVVKVYATRVGNGEFITELEDIKLASYIRDLANEYGSVTGRPRRIGWLDLVALKYSLNISGATTFALTLIDIVNGLPYIKVCVDYVDSQGNSVSWEESRNKKITPIYRTFNCWNQDFKIVTSYDQFSSEFKLFLAFLEEFLGAKACIISYGKSRQYTLIR